MFLGSYTKQPWEAFRVSIDYSAHASGAAITSITPDITVPSGMQMIGQSVSNGVLQIYLGGGSDGQVYTWRVRSTLSTEAGELARAEDEFLVLVEDVVGDVGTPDGSFAGPGSPSTRLDQSEGDSRTYLLSCAALLRPDELLTGITSLTPATGLTATSGVLRQGRYLEVVLSGSVDGEAAYADRLLRVELATTKGGVRGAIVVRVHAI